MSELSGSELDAIELLSDFYNVMVAGVIGDGTTREADIRELADKVHQLQAMVMSQACARAMPSHFRLLGEGMRA